jgi:hypothetical protein
VGWAVSDRMNKGLAIRALNMIANLRNLPKGCIFHRDRGSQYAAYDYQKRLQKYEIKPSLSSKGNYYDNAAAETLFKSLKAELIWRQSWLTRRQADAARGIRHNLTMTGSLAFARMISKRCTSVCRSLAAVSERANTVSTRSSARRTAPKRSRMPVQDW